MISYNCQKEKGKQMYLVVWFDSGWNEITVQRVKDMEAAKKLLAECEDNVDYIDPKIIIL